MKDRSKKRHPGVFSALPFFGENKVLNRPSWPAPRSEIFHGDTQSPHRRQKLERDSGPAHRN
jgi:hypothetical protein